MAEWFKLTNSKDGRQRLDIKTEHRLTIYDMAVLLVMNERGSDEGDWYVWAMKFQTRHEVINAVKLALMNYTLDTAHIRVGDNSMHDAVDQVEKRLNLLWQEVQ